MFAKRTAAITLKLALSGAMIFGIATLFVVLSDDGTVPEAQADLTNLVSRTHAQHHDFARVIARAGLEPRPFDHNGNQIFFAVGESDRSPKDLLTYFQREFKAAGINSDIYTEPTMPFTDTLEEYQRVVSSEAQEKANHAMLNGEIVPYHVTDDFVSMGGIVPHRKTNSGDDLLHDWRPNADGVPDIATNARAFRYLEARRDPSTGVSVVTSSFSDNYFDFKKAIGDGPVAGVGVDPDVPSCVGCERRHRLKGLSGIDPFTLNQFESPRSADATVSQYRSAMINRGWQPTKSDDLLEALREFIPEIAYYSDYMINFERGDEAIGIVVSPNRHGTSSVITLQAHD